MKLLLYFMEKIQKKIKEHFGKLILDVQRISKLDEFKSDNIVPLLLLNISDKELLTEVNRELKTKNRDRISLATKIVNLDLLRFREE